MINPLRGMKDLTFDQSQRFEHIINIATQVAQKYGYNYIETPILEETSLFKRSVGDSSDIVSKEMYQFQDKGKNDICLRPEGTAGVVRSFISYYGPMFRYERPQKGRLRQFHQFGCESFGEASVYEDFTIINMISQIFNELSVEYSLKINSLGCPSCMPTYKTNLLKFLEANKIELCKDCNFRIDSNPIRTLDCKNEKCQSILTNAPKLLNQLCAECDPDFTKLLGLLDSSGIKYEIDTNLVRGLDYYNKTAFEFVSDQIGAQNSIAGGGRYDKLVEYLDGKPTPAIGFAIGIERIMELVQLPFIELEGFYLGAMSEDAIDKLLMIASNKRTGFKVTFDYVSKGFQSHLKAADKSGARYCVLMGDLEIETQTLRIKDLETKEETSVSIDSFLSLV